VIILAHRANLTGPHSVVENSPAACAKALAEGFGLETDLRRDAGGDFYISHDPLPRTEENRLEVYSALFQKHPHAELAINVKELGYESALIELMNSGRLGRRSFYFDFELLEPKTPGNAQRKIKSLPASERVRLASRLSDRNEPLSQCLSIPSEVVWGDEFDRLWMTESEARQVRAAKRLLYLISPEIHGFDLATTKRRWQDFKDWGVDGLCTDYPILAREFFGA
jgi:glycerophosphoryl diester phosphodiesterase